MAEKDVLTLAEAARFIRVSTNTLGDMARAERIPCQRAGREWRFLRRALEEWLRGPAQERVAAEGVQVCPQAPLSDEPDTEHRPVVRGHFRDTAFTRNRREPMHRWVPWIAGFSAAFVEGVFDAVISSPPREVTVLDPFAGVGTTLIEGLRRGCNVAGFEINPYAALACRVKVDAVQCDVNSLSETVERLGAFMRRKLRSKKAAPRSVPPAGFRTRSPFLSPGVERQALFLRDFIVNEKEQFVRDILKVALGSVIVGFSNYSYEPSLGTRSAAGKSDIVNADVPGVVTQKLREMIADIAFMQRHMARFDYEPSAQVHQRSYLDAGDVVPPASIDVLITSPPYLNNYHYIRNTRPQMYWLDLAKEPADLKQVEVESFGQFWQTVRAGPEVELKVNVSGLRGCLDVIRRLNADKGVYGGKGWANYAARYFNDCDRFCEVTRTLMKPGARAIVVIGNNILQGVEIKTDEFFARIAEAHGFRVAGMHRVRRKRTGSSIVNSSVRAGVTRKRTELYETAVELIAP